MKPVQGRQGQVVPGVYCPRCGYQVVYNGNYFCDDWGVTNSDCTWALSHDETTGEPLPTDQAVWRQIKKSMNLKENDMAPRKGQPKAKNHSIQGPIIAVLENRVGQTVSREFITNATGLDNSQVRNVMYRLAGQLCIDIVVQGQAWHVHSLNRRHPVGTVEPTATVTSLDDVRQAKAEAQPEPTVSTSVDTETVEAEWQPVSGENVLLKVVNVKGHRIVVEDQCGDLWRLSKMY